MTENPYQAPVAPETNETVSEKRAILLPLLTIVFLSGTLAAMLFYRGRILKVFVEFDVDLPVITHVMFHPLIVIVHAGLLLLALGAGLGVKSRRMVVFGSMTLLCSGVFLFAFEVLAVTVPLIKVVHGLS